jgi:hypothetical protein
MVRGLLPGLFIMRTAPGSRVERYEVSFPVLELPLPAVERYRPAPMRSLDLEVEFEDESETEWFGPSSKSGPSPDRYLRARCWASEE